MIVMMKSAFSLPRFSEQVKAEMERLSVKLTELSPVEPIPTGSWFKKKMKKWMV